jgi:hypothetical protein
MSTSLLYHAFGIRGYDYRASRYDLGEIFFKIEAPRKVPDYRVESGLC